MGESIIPDYGAALSFKSYRGKNCLLSSQSVPAVILNPSVVANRDVSTPLCHAYFALHVYFDFIVLPILPSKTRSNLRMQDCIAGEKRNLLYIIPSLLSRRCTRFRCF
jgi:hypothetical protein